MATNLALDDKLIEEALKIGRHKTKKEAVTAALKEYILSRKQQKIKESFGTIVYEPDYDYKKQRSVK
jgi:Arc/MetJ family transcription regulator